MSNFLALRISKRSLVELFLAIFCLSASACTEKCKPKEERRCGLEIGTCRAGWQLCNDSGFWSECLGSVEPTTEICDGLDNDCNGVSDDIDSRPCSNSCGEQGTETCINSQWSCSSPNPLEICEDEIDNDCDGSVDEGCNCFASQPCGSNTGQCKQGIQHCFDGLLTECQGAIGSSLEVCDGIDNDCDGKIDEELSPRPCKGECGPQQCINGAWTSCKGSSEGTVADGKDNDCNGIIDDLVRPCTINGCTYGTERFINGQWNGCTLPEEVCDGKDNNCDGEIDEGLGEIECTNVCGTGKSECINGKMTPCAVPAATLPCSTACGSGTLMCENGKFGECSAPKPKTESCNNIDDDCDGIIDNRPNGEHLINSCPIQCLGGVSVKGQQECVDGVWSECKRLYPCPL